MSKKSEQDAFYKGYAAALAGLVRWHNEPTQAIDIARMEGVTLAQLKAAGVGEYDLGTLTEDRCMKEWKRYAKKNTRDARQVTARNGFEDGGR